MQIPPPDTRADLVLRAGDAVRVRRQRWRVAAVRSYGGCSLLTLTGSGPLNGGAKQRVITPFDTVEPAERRARLRVVGMRGWRRRCRALLADQGPASMLRAAVRARIELLPHQLEPAIAIVRGLGSRLLIADEVGLGKTIQAGLVVSELIARAAADRILVLTPAGLREQWAGELSDRFGLHAAVIDMRDARQRATALPIGVNPWSTVPIAIASIDFVKRAEVLPDVLSCRWDVIIVDEAHGVTPGSDRYEAVAALCGCAPYVLLLTATPHSGDRESFVSLCRLGQRDDDRLLAFRRRRSEVSSGSKRRIHRLLIRPSADETRMHAMLARFAAAVHAAGRDRSREICLALATLHKRALSSARSLEQSALRRLAILPAQDGEACPQLWLPLDDAAGELDASDEAPVWAEPLLHDIDQERRMLLAIADAARAAAQRETKLTALERLVARIRKRHDRAIVFTEYRDTLLHVRERLPFPCAILHGGLTREERRSALQEFVSGRRPILLATDAAGEGLNLHHACRVVVNLELPWNPVRLEQRAGRVDRIGQRQTVHAFHLIARDTGETRILDRLKARIANAQRDIATTDPLGGDDQNQEQALLRLVVGGDAADAPETESRSLDGTGAQIVCLAAEAALEHARLAGARAWVDDGGTGTGIVAAGDQLIAVARRSKVRAALAARVLILSQSTFEDAAGRIVASHITPFGVRLASRIRRRALQGAVLPLIRVLESLALAPLDPAFETWALTSESHHCAFWGARLTREQAIARSHAAAGPAAFQPGLFDRRGERRQEIDEQRRDERAADATRHIAAAERAAVINAPSTRVTLVLVP